MTRHRYVVTAATGTESLVVHELRALGLSAREGRRGTILFEAERLDAARACIHVRSGVRVLEEVAAFGCDGKDSLYAGTRKVDWSDHITPRLTLAVRVKAAARTPFANSTYAAQVIKDGIVDAIRARHGERPSIDREQPDVLVVAHLGGDRAELYLDVAGEPLHRRGYRVAPTEAPLKETLAAALVLFARYDGGGPLCDPMTGSGTIAIEAARIARGIAPRARAALALERWASCDPATRRAIEGLRVAAMAAELPRAPAPIEAFDVSPGAIAAARRNAAAAGVDADIRFEVRDVGALAHPGTGGLVAVNPPYGERIEETPDRLDSLYRTFGERIRSFEGANLVALSGNPLFERAIGWPPRWSREVHNGPIPCRISYWELRVTAQAPTVSEGGSGTRSHRGASRRRSSRRGH